MLTSTITSVPSNSQNCLSYKCIIFISSCSGVWGGSEELWAASTKYLKQQKQAVHVFKLGVMKTHTRMLELQRAGIEVIDINCQPRFFLKQLNRMILRLPKLKGYVNRYVNRFLPAQFHLGYCNYSEMILKQSLKQLQPSLVVISQGDNYDGLNFANICRQLNLPYALISHKAHDCFWPVDEIRSYMREMFQQAKRCFFVSQQNLLLTEAQIGERLINAEVIRNPHYARVSDALPWIAPKDDCFKLACVGRYYFFDKGQDLLLKVLAQDKWKSRNLQVTFFGEGPHHEALIDLAKILGLNNVSFPGFVNDIVSVWREFHALILPSRGEGLPIALVEAMMCGRIGIVTDVGGMSEVIEDNITGFIARGACFQTIDEALERAWMHRDKWEKMGQLAAELIRTMVPSDPAEVFGKKVLELCEQ
jgi:glycosyltransferase involved in cell wall biosynthesis